MKQMFLLFALTLLAGRGFSQNVDSLTIVHEVDSLIELNQQLMGEQKLEEALAAVDAAEQKVATAFGKDDDLFAYCLTQHAIIFVTTGQFQLAEPLLLEARDVRAKALGTANAGYANCLNNLTILYYYMGEYEKSINNCLEALSVQEKTVGKAHQDYGKCLSNLANLYIETGRFEDAERLYFQAGEIIEKAVGKKSEMYGDNLNNLGILYQYTARFEQSEQYLLEAKAIWETIFGKESDNYAASLNNLAILYVDMGSFEKSERLYVEAIPIREKVYGKEHPEYASLLNNLAILYQEMERFKESEPLFLESTAIREKTLGKDNPDYAASLGNLALTYYYLGRYEQAEPLYLEALSIFEKIFGKEGPGVAGYEYDLGQVYFKTGRYDKAESLWRESLDIQTKAVGKESPKCLHTMNSMAGLFQAQGRYDEALPFFLEANRAQRQNLIHAFRFLSEKEQADFAATFERELNMYFSFLQTMPRQRAEATSEGYDNALFYKGFLLFAVSQRNRAADSDSTATELSNLQKSFLRRLEKEYVKPISERDSARITEWESRADSLEKELARRVAGFGYASKQVGWKDVQANLKASEAALEFVRFRYWKKEETDSVLYAAFVVRPGWDAPKFISLFEEKQLDSLLLGRDIAAKANNLYTTRGAIPLSGKNVLSKSLFNLVWQPLEKPLEGVKTIYFSPSGQLNKLNLSAIPIGKDKMLADRYNLVELGSTRQLAIPAEMNIKNNNALLFGGIQYDMDSTAVSRANAGLKMSETVASRGELSFAQTDSTLRGGLWNYLPGTEKEVSAVEEIMRTSGIDAKTQKGWTATEEAFKTIGQSGKPSPRVLHLATHGFFFPDPKINAQKTMGDELEPVFKLSDNPLIRSGLLLTGANHAWTTGKPLKPGMEDGILTAYEISQMNLSNTELVVLSACETGLGDIEGNEGVYGLQRAFKIAGAKYLIMSLWQVPDQETSVFMTTLYHNWLEKKMTIPDAFRSTQKEMRERFVNPYQWAGFVLVE